MKNKNVLSFFKLSQKQQLYVCFITVAVISFFTLSLFIINTVFAVVPVFTYTCNASVPNSSAPNNGYTMRDQFGEFDTGQCTNTQYCLANGSQNPCHNITSCICEFNGQAGGRFNCNPTGYNGSSLNYNVVRSCGSNLYCVNGTSQGGAPWPCTTVNPANDPCSYVKNGSGTYCGGTSTDGKTDMGGKGTSGHLYTCDVNGHETADQNCSTGRCYNNASGQPATCDNPFGGGSQTSSTSNSCTPTPPYTECESGNPTACLGTGNGTTHNVPKGNIAQVTHNCDGSYTCKNLGPCSSSSSNSSNGSSSSDNSSSSSSQSSSQSSGNSSSSSSSVPPGDAYVSLAIQLPGVGNINGGNPHPLHTTRQVTLSIYTPDQDPSNVNDKPVMVRTTVTLNTSLGNSLYGYFVNPKIAVGHLFGDYQIFIKANQYVRTAFIDNQSSNNDFTLTPQQTTALPPTTLVAGDIFPPARAVSSDFGDNILDISDYNMLISCFGNGAETTTCPSKSAADLNDDGIIDGIDLNILLRSFALLQNQ